MGTQYAKQIGRAGAQIVADGGDDNNILDGKILQNHYNKQPLGTDWQNGSRQKTEEKEQGQAGAGKEGGQVFHGKKGIRKEAFWQEQALPLLPGFVPVN
ncbi:hypothetical protein JCM39068_33630 [Desulfocastanea catecholica]